MWSKSPRCLTILLFWIWKLGYHLWHCWRQWINECWRKNVLDYFCSCTDPHLSCVGMRGKSCYYSRAHTMVFIFVIYSQDARTWCIVLWGDSHVGVWKLFVIQLSQLCLFSGSLRNSIYFKMVRLLVAYLRPNTCLWKPGGMDCSLWVGRITSALVHSPFWACCLGGDGGCCCCSVVRYSKFGALSLGSFSLTYF